MVSDCRTPFWLGCQARALPFPETAGPKPEIRMDVVVVTKPGLARVSQLIVRMEPECSSLAGKPD